MSKAGRTRQAELAVDPTTGLFARFFSKVIETATGCWLLDDGSVNRYARFNAGTGEHVGAHRLSWILTRGPVPPGLQVHHHCDTPRCVRPNHLWVGTQSANVRDMFNKSRYVPHHLRRRPTHCRNEHLYTPETLLPKQPRYGGHRCLLCYEENERRRQERRQNLQSTDRAA